MLRIISHIEQLLYSHDCVIVPDFGGFVLRDVSASSDSVSRMFFPPRKELGFNSTLQHSDGLLAESYMRSYGVAYNTAKAMVAEDVCELKSILQENKKISLESIGTFTIGSEGRVEYHSLSDNSYDISHYALRPFEMFTLDEIAETESRKLSEEKHNQKKNIVYLPINRTLLRVVSASAAAVALFFLASTPVKDVNHLEYKAGFVPTNIVISSVAVSDEEATSTASVKEESVTVVAPVEQPVAPAAAPVVVDTPKKMYHIVVGSFPTEKQANDFLSGVDKSTYKNSDKVFRNDKYRVYVDRFDSRDEAERYLENVRSNPKYKDAWLFISK
jgi:hypothetical protein